ncbi:MAG: NADH-quinone oxidoreductase subunit N [Halodesulfurarchaeum sp.]
MNELVMPHLTPQYLFAITAIALLLADTVFPKSKRPKLLAAIAALGSSLVALISAWFLAAGTGSGTTVPEVFAGMIVVDGMSLFFTFIFGSVATLVVIASFDYLQGSEAIAEYYSLVSLAALGMSLMAVSNNLAAVFVSLELASLPSYGLVAYLKHDEGSVEAGLKYFLIGALSSAVMVYGISLVYGATGTLHLSGIAEALQGGLAGLEGLLGLGLVMLIGGFLFKTASVPFHFWAPEAYEGAPAPISAFISSASKAAGFAVAFRVLVQGFPLDLVGGMVPWGWLFVVLAIITMTVGNFAAATQENVKRMLAYSSIGHAGYVLMGLAALTGSGELGTQALVLGAAMMHLLVYGFMNTGAFLFVALAEKWNVGRTFEDYNGLARQAPYVSVAMTVFMFSLAGLPVGGGFLSKYVLFAGTVQAGFWWLAGIAAINSALSLYYYSRVVKALWIEDPTDSQDLGPTPTGMYVAVIGAAVVTVGLLVAFDPVAETAISAASLLLEGGI